MLRDGLTTNSNFTKYLQQLSNEELDDLTIKLNSCGYTSSKNIEELINLVELFIEDHNLSKNISKEHLWLELLNNGYKIINGHLIGPNVNLEGANLEKADLSGISLYNVNAKGANFTDAIIEYQKRERRFGKTSKQL